MILLLNGNFTLNLCLVATAHICFLKFTFLLLYDIVYFLSKINLSLRSWMFLAETAHLSFLKILSLEVEKFEVVLLLFYQFVSLVIFFYLIKINMVTNKQRAYLLESYESCEYLYDLLFV